MFNKRINSYLGLHLLFILYSFISVLSKQASNYDFLSSRFIYLYTIILLMFVIYAFFWQLLIKRHSLVLAYTSKGVVLFWVSLWSFFFFGENISINNILGAIIIIVGIYMVYKDEY